MDKEQQNRIERLKSIPAIAGTTAAVCTFTLVNTFLKENVESSGLLHGARLRVGRLTAASAAAVKAGNEVDRFVTRLGGDSGPVTRSNHGR